MGGGRFFRYIIEYGLKWVKKALKNRTFGQFDLKQNAYFELKGFKINFRKNFYISFQA